MKVYLSGPIDGCTTEELAEWREEATKQFNLFGIQTLDPTRRVSTSLEVVEKDKKDITDSDLILVNYMPDKRMIGTAMEVFFAFTVIKIPVIVITNNYSISPWLIKYSNLQTVNLDSAMYFIRLFHDFFYRK